MGNLTRAVKTAKAGIARVNESAVEVTCVPPGQGGASNGRRLAKSVDFLYKIQAANGSEANSMASRIESANLTEVTSTINELLPEGSSFKGAIEVTGVRAEAVMATITTTSTAASTEGDGELEDSHAHTPAALGSLAMAMIAATLMSSR